MTSNNTNKNLSSTKALALIVDDADENRMILASLLSTLGYESFEAKDGSEAVALFSRVKPDIIFMDIQMPVMDGYQATRKIKALSKDDFVPILFITGANTEETLKACIDAGGDDFLPKPFDLNVLKTKIFTLERVRGIYRRVQELNETLNHENQISNDVFNRAIFSKNTQIKTIQSWFKTDGQLNNDLFLVKHTPANGVNILLGNFNTQSPITAVGALPCSEVFRSMTDKGFSPKHIVNAINHKLIEILPTGIYLNAIFININEELNQIKICNLGMPDVYLISNKHKNISYTVKTRNEFLGKDSQFNSQTLFETLEINPNQRLFLIGNGILNCENTSGETFNNNLLQITINEAIQTDNISEYFKSKIRGVTQQSKSKLALSVIEIPLCAELLTSTLARNEISNVQPIEDTIIQEACIDFSITIRGRNLKNIDPVPTLINIVKDVTSIGSHQEALYTIFTELYINSLDHGVLGLSSSLKNEPNGFIQYFDEKETLLSSITTGYITIKISLTCNEVHNQLIIYVQDSGAGFDYKKLNSKEEKTNSLLSGRGITLVRALCESFEFHNTGNESTSVYIWPVD